MFNVSSAWGNSRHHKCRGNFLSIPQRMLMKWALNVCIAFSARFLWWSFGGMSWNVIWFLLIVCLKFLEHSLSSMCLFGLIPALCSWSGSSWYAQIISPDMQFFMAATRIALLVACCKSHDPTRGQGCTTSKMKSRNGISFPVETKFCFRLVLPLLVTQR